MTAQYTKLVLILKDETLEDAKVTAHMIVEKFGSLIYCAWIPFKAVNHHEFEGAYRNWEDRWVEIMREIREKPEGWE